jgi:hypothetical protein
MECQSIPCKALAQNAEDPLGIEEILECQHGIVSEADKGTTAPSSWRSVNFRTTSGKCCETRFGAVSTAHWPAATDASNAGN